MHIFTRGVIPLVPGFHVQVQCGNLFQFRKKNSSHFPDVHGFNIVMAFITAVYPVFGFLSGKKIMMGILGCGITEQTAHSLNLPDITA
jgi:hypothetical protein